MTKQIELDGRSYNIDELDPELLEKVKKYFFILHRLEEMKNMIVLLEQARKNYHHILKAEVLSNKSGFFVDN